MTDDYVTNASWLRVAGRVDQIDDVADQFERPATAWPARPQTGWTSAVVRWPRPIRLPRSA